MCESLSHSLLLVLLISLLRLILSLCPVAFPSLYISSLNNQASSLALVGFGWRFDFGGREVPVGSLMMSGETNNFFAHHQV